MKLSKAMHVLNVLVGFAGVVTAIVAVTMGANELKWGVTREHILFCSGLLMLMAIWLAINTIHHVMIEKTGEII
jgi:hypothetical protein